MLKDQVPNHGIVWECSLITWNLKEIIVENFKHNVSYYVSFPYRAVPCTICPLCGMILAKYLWGQNVFVVSVCEVVTFDDCHLKCLSLSANLRQQCSYGDKNAGGREQWQHKGWAWGTYILYIQWFHVPISAFSLIISSNKSKNKLEGNDVILVSVCFFCCLSMYQAVNYPASLK